MKILQLDLADRLLAVRLHRPDAARLDGDRHAAGRAVREGAPQRQLPERDQDHADWRSARRSRTKPIARVSSSPMAPPPPPSSTSPAAPPAGSRAARRLRRTGRVPGVLYGGGAEPVGFDADARELRHALAGSGAVLDLSVDGGESHAGRAQGGPAPPGARRDRPRRPAARAPGRGDPRGRAGRALGVEDAPGVKEGGVLEQITRELNVEALPDGDPRVDRRTTSARWRSATRSCCRAITAPEGVTLLDDLEETVVATLSPPETADRSRGGNRVRDGARRRGRGRRRGRRRRVRRAPPGRSSGPATPLRRWRGPVDWLIVGLGNPGREYAGTPPQRRLHGRRGAGRALGAAAPRTASAAASPRVVPRQPPLGAGVPSAPRWRCCARRPT